MRWNSENRDWLFQVSQHAAYTIQFLIPWGWGLVKPMAKRLLGENTRLPKGSSWWPNVWWEYIMCSLRGTNPRFPYKSTVKITLLKSKMTFGSRRLWLAGPSPLKWNFGDFQRWWGTDQAEIILQNLTPFRCFCILSTNYRESFVFYYQDIPHSVSEYCF